MPQPEDDDPYWRELLEIGEISLHPRDAKRKLYLQVHMSEERYGSEMERELGVRLSQPRGVRVYVHARPCILVPRIMLTVALSDDAHAPSSELWGEAVGEVVESHLEGMERRQLGTAQAWYVRRIGACQIPSSRRRGSEDNTSRSAAYLAAKANGDKSMPSKRRASEDAYGTRSARPERYGKSQITRISVPSDESLASPAHSIYNAGLPT